MRLGRPVSALALAAVLAAACAPTGAPQTGASRTVVSSAGAPGVGAPMNRGRTAAGLAPLAPSSALTDAAVYQARYAAARGELTHRSAGNATVMDRVKARGFGACIAAENLAAGQPDAASVTAGWLASSGHRKNIMLSRVTHWGAGMAQTSDGMRYWSMVVAGPC
jgi:uncharacterized protein YkwD